MWMVFIILFLPQTLSLLLAAVVTCLKGNPCLNGGKCYELSMEDDTDLGQMRVTNEVSRDERAVQEPTGFRYWQLHCACPFAYTGTLCENSKQILYLYVLVCVCVCVCVCVFACVCVL